MDSTNSHDPATPAGTELALTRAVEGDLSRFVHERENAVVLYKDDYQEHQGRPHVTSHVAAAKISARGSFRSEVIVPDGKCWATARCPV